jgi:hypothetical protein
MTRPPPDKTAFAVRVTFAHAVPLRVKRTLLPVMRPEVILVLQPLVTPMVDPVKLLREMCRNFAMTMYLPPIPQL